MSVKLGDKVRLLVNCIDSKGNLWKARSYGVVWAIAKDTITLQFGSGCRHYISYADVNVGDVTECNIQTKV